LLCPLELRGHQPGNILHRNENWVKDLLASFPLAIVDFLFVIGIEKFAAFNYLRGKIR
jgi:hypothetical protein